jgi:NADPH-dependent 2,4-dienoyl-CoA reductase/sulfur reductase-like enzyme
MAILAEHEDQMNRVIIVGASVAGVGLASELRQLGFRGDIVLIDAQRRLPYDRPPLSKSFLLSETQTDAIQFFPDEYYRDQSIELRLGARVVSLDPGHRTVELETGERIAGDVVVVASGARARQFPCSDPETTIWTVREADDAIALRKHLVAGARLGLIGGGFIGAEIASSARELGLRVTIFEAAALPFHHIVGPEIATRLSTLHNDAAVKLICGSPIGAVQKQGDTFLIDTKDGVRHVFDVVVAGLGSLPNVEWLSGSGIGLDGGVVCDECGRTSVEGVFAVGDVARWYNPSKGIHIREEHWTSARVQARIVAQQIAGTKPDPWSNSVPYFWSDMYGKRIQVLGRPNAADNVRIVYENFERGAFVAEYWRGDQLAGVAGCNAAAKTMRYLARLAEPAPN